MSARYAVWQKGNERGIRCVETEIVIRTATDEEAELLVAQMNRYEDSEQERDAARALASQLAEALTALHSVEPIDGCEPCAALAEYDAAKKGWEQMSARAESPHAKAVERIVKRHTPVGPAFAGDRSILAAAILRLVARVEREAYADGILKGIDAQDRFMNGKRVAIPWPKRTAQKGARRK